MTFQEAIQLAVGTVALRPYVFVFFIVYLVAAVTHIGLGKTLVFTVVGYLIAFTSEFSSINTGIPYGWYYYIDSTKSHELWIAGVPFFDSLSYVFLSYCSYATALLVISPIKTWRWGFATLETRKLRRSFAALFLGALFQVFLDIIIDPVALQGNKWFLGQIYGYREQGVHFGVPLSNYLGWWLVSFMLVFVLQRLAGGGAGESKPPPGCASLPFRSLLGPILYLSIIVFNISMALLIGENLMALSSIFIFVLPILIVLVLIIRRTNRYSREELAEHLRDYPWSSVTGARR